MCVLSPRDYLQSPRIDADRRRCKSRVAIYDDAPTTRDFLLFENATDGMAGMKVKTTRKFAAFHSPTFLLFLLVSFSFRRNQSGDSSAKKEERSVLEMFHPVGVKLCKLTPNNQTSPRPLSLSPSTSLISFSH
jgi:hypothetical protein